MSKKAPKVQQPQLPYVGRIASYLNDSGGKNPAGVRGGIPQPIALAAPATTASTINPFSRMTQFAGMGRAGTLGGVS